MRSVPRVLLLLGLLGAAVCVVAPAAGADAWPDPARLDEAVESALSGKQTGFEALDPVAGPVPLEPAIRINASPLGSFMELLAYLLLAAGAVLLITLIVQRFVIRGDDGEQAAAADDAGAEADDHAALRIPAAATSAAARGDFGEALRLLLGEVLPRFYQGQGRGWPEAWTSRQCLRRVARAEPARDGLAELVLTVERHHFGGLPAVRSDWESWERRVVGLQPAAGNGAS